MGERVKKVTAKVKEFFGKMSKGLKVAIIIVLVLAIGVIVTLAINRSNRPYSVLFTGLNQDDMTSVLTYLMDNGVSDYQIRNNDTILVREEQEVELKAAILQQGYPTSGYAYTTYLDNVGMLSSESDRKQLTKYDLQDQMKAVIRHFDGVKDADVNVTTTTNSRNILSDSVQTAKAAVLVEMQRGKELSAKLVNAIRNYVTHSVEGLEISDVSISDTEGNEYSGGDSATLADAANLKLSLQEMINAQVRSNILGVLTPYFGMSNLEVRVHSEVDTSRTYQETLQYLEPDWAERNANGRGIIGTWIWDSGIVRGGNATAGGTVGTSTNADLNEYVINEGDITGNEQEIGTAGQIDYKVGTQHTQRDNAGGVLTDLMVAIAINRTSLENDINREDWIPFIARAAGIGTELENEKIAIQVYPFYVYPDDEAAAEEHEPTLIERLNLPWWAIYAAIGGGILFLIILIVILILRKKAKKRRAEREAAEAAERERLAALAEAQAIAMQEAMAQVPPEEGADIMGINTERTMSLRKDVRQFAEENPAIAAQMIKTWLHSSEEG